MTIENYIQAGLQHLGIYSESISDIIYFMALLVIIGIINWIIHVLTRQWLARIVLKLTKRTATMISCSINDSLTGWDFSSPPS